MHRLGRPKGDAAAAASRGAPAAALLLLAQILHAGLLVSGEAACTAPEPEAARSQGAWERCSLSHRVQAKAPPDGCVCNPAAQLCQPCRLSAKVRGSITLPCTFSYEKRKRPLPTREGIQVSWRLGGFRGRFFFNHTEPMKHYTDPEFSGRVTLVGDPLERHDASIRIEALRESDANVYFCRISVKGGPQWQSIEGTNLTIEGTRLPVTEAPPTPTSSTLRGALIGAGLLIAGALLGLVMFFAWRKGCCPRRPGRRSPEERAEEAPELGLQRATATQYGGPALLQPPAASGESGLTYATLVLPHAGAKQVPRRGAEEETTYAAI